jgi:hypothetical protein
MDYSILGSIGAPADTRRSGASYKLHVLGSSCDSFILIHPLFLSSLAHDHEYDTSHHHVRTTTQPQPQITRSRSALSARFGVRLRVRVARDQSRQRQLVILRRPRRREWQ